MKTTGIDMDAMLARLHLRNARRIWKDLCAKAEKESWTYQQLLESLISEEIAQRAMNRVGREARRAGFPYFKTIDDFDFTFQATLRLSMVGTYLSPDFVTDGRNVVLLGKPGRGKTHLAIAIAYRAIQNGFAARFTTAAELIDALSQASQAGDFRSALAEWVFPNVLVIDELGYLAYGNDAANLLFHIVNERHLKRRPMIFTTNKGLKSWGRVLHDQDLGDAIVDRILERGAVLRLDGPSVRSRHVNPQDLEGPDPVASEPAIVSGMDRPAFPEPTAEDGGMPTHASQREAGWRTRLHPARKGEKRQSRPHRRAGTVLAVSLPR
jgi:DNA replication protein DnaC